MLVEVAGNEPAQLRWCVEPPTKLQPQPGKNLPRSATKQRSLVTIQSLPRPSRRGNGCNVRNTSLALSKLSTTARQSGPIASMSFIRRRVRRPGGRCSTQRGELVIFTAGTPEEIAPAMDKAKASGATALNVLTAPLFSFNRRIVIERAAALGLPAIYEWPEMAEDGGLLGYGARLNSIYRQLARLLVKVLRGAKPKDLPVEQPTNFELVINLTTAKALGLTIPEAFLMRADKVIE
jgi:hypothetical protein